MPLALDLTDRVALVTGGARGVGLGIARRFVEAGATVVTCGRSPASLTWDHRECDVRDPAAVAALVASVVADHGSLDVLVNNAGGAPYADAAAASPRFHASVVDLNLLAPLALMQACRPHVSSIVNVSSVSALRPSPGTAAYGAAKAGLDSLTRTLAVEWAPAVRVNAIDVGLVETERSDLHYGGRLEAVAATVPLGRLATPDDVGALAVFLASPLASYVTGASVACHGGGEAPAFLAAAAGEDT